MKRNISELLNDLDAEDVKLTGCTPLSSRKISNMTMKRVGVSRKTVGIQWVGRIAVLAAVIMLLTMTAFAAENVVDYDLLSAVCKKPLSDKQQHIVETLNKDFSSDHSTETATGGDVAITPISSICDTRICYLHVRLEAKEGTVLPDLPDNQRYSFSGKSYREKMELKYYQYTEMVNDVKVTALPDEDPSDSVKEFILEIHADWRMGFSGERASLHISGLWIKDVNKDVYKNVLSCDLTLDFTVGYNGDAIDIKDPGLSMYIKQYDFTVKLERMYITHLSMVIHYTATEPNDFQEIIPDGGVCRVVMKDGTSILLGDQSDVSDGEMVGYFRVSKAEAHTGLNLTNLARESYLDDKEELHFDQPVALEDIDYIIWCGDQVIDVN